jgi:hypothetical protein
MKIEALQVQLAANHTLAQRDQEITRTSRAPALAAPAAPAAPPSTVVSLSGQAQAAQGSVRLTSSPAAGTPAADNDPEAIAENDPRYAVVKYLYEQITGLRFRATAPDLQQPTAGAQVAPPAQGALTITHTDTHSEAEQTRFHAQGELTTSDGQQIKFDFSLNLQRSESSQTSRSERVGPRVKDPLVLNFAGSSAQLTAQKYQFDLNGDGQNEAISFTGPGSAFLALDKNGDGAINNGTELFGAQSGDGFAELAAYDQDQNQVIDENDAVFGQLRLYSKNDAGQDQLLTLTQKGVGAILLAHAETPFALKDAQNRQQGQLRASGVYLGQSGTVGSVQQIDLVV